jgi:hypothetical protein
MSGRSVERRIRDPVSCRESLYIIFRPPVHSVAGLVRVGGGFASDLGWFCIIAVSHCISVYLSVFHTVSQGVEGVSRNTSKYARYERDTPSYDCWEMNPGYINRDTEYA